VAEPIGLVASGGGARGAYEAGVLSVLLPELASRGARPNLFVGTSVGAINASYLAASRHLPPEEAAIGGVERWTEVTKARVVRPIWLRQVPLTMLRYAGEVLAVPGVRMPSLLDPKPLEKNLDRWIDWVRIHDNVAAGRVSALAVVATAARSGRTVVFVEGDQRHRLHHSHVLDYVKTRIEAEHVRASAAIPFLFPPVRVEAPAEARGWYVDGGTRLNTPIKPALDLGAERLVVIGTEAAAEASSEDGRHDCAAPNFGDSALHLLQGTLVDPVGEDVRMLGNVNLFFSDGERGDGEGAPAATRYRAARGKPAYRRVPYIFVAPKRRGAIGELAAEVFRARYGGLKGLRSPDLRLLNQLLGGDSPTHGELLSYLLFDREFIRKLIDMGQRDARAYLSRAADIDDIWQLGPPEELTRPPQPSPAIRAGRAS
jgi:NTE family protein